MDKLKVLIACEYSGTVRDAFTKLGHEAMSCDLLPTETSGAHWQGSIDDVICLGDWDLMIAHPPCTYLCNSGVRWLHTQQGRWIEMIRGAKFFNQLLQAHIPYIAVENPIPHKYAIEVIGRGYDQIVQPYQFGHTESKATCLWLKGLPSLKETHNVKEEWKLLPKSEAQKIHYLPPSKDRAKLRSKTYQGIADAMAKQWGNYIMNQKYLEL